MRLRHGRSGCLLSLLVALTSPAAAQDVSYIQLLSLPSAADTIGYPQGVTADPHTGEVFVVDSRASRILIFDSDGLFSYEIPGGTAFSGPSDVAVDPEGYLLVSAFHQGRTAVIELDFDGLFLREVVLWGLPPESAPLGIRSIALSPSGDRVYALDDVNLRLWIADRDGSVLSNVDLAAGLDEEGRQNMILGHVDVYGETVLVAEASAGQIRMFDLDGKRERRVGVKGTGPCKIARPRAAGLTEEGELVVIDQQRMLVVRWDPRSNQCLGEHLGFGGGPGALYFPVDLALDRTGRMYITQSYQGRVQVYEGMKPAAAPPEPATVRPPSP